MVASFINWNITGQYSEMKDFIQQLPKAELHVHIEGTLEPHLIFFLAKRNNISLPYASIEDLTKAYNFKNLQEFLDLYYQGTNVLIHEQDFYDMTWDYLEKAKKQNIAHTEIFFDPQTHTDRGIAFDTVINGIYKALEDGKKELGISSKLIMCILRHLDEPAAFDVFEHAIKHKDKITAIGLDSSEINNPPSKFQHVFKLAREHGFLTVAHAGEEGPAAYIWEAINLLKVRRIDHGYQCVDDADLMQAIIDQQIPLTMCPLSNLSLKVFDDLRDHPAKILLDKGMCITINSDDPAYFGGYINENYLALAEALNLSKEDMVAFAKNSFEASFLEDKEKQKFIDLCCDHI